MASPSTSGVNGSSNERLTRTSHSHTRKPGPPSSTPAASSAGRSNPTAKSTTCKSKSKTSTSPNRDCAATSEYKVSNPPQPSHQHHPQLTNAVQHRPHRRPPNPNNVLRRRNHRPQTPLPHHARELEQQRKNRPPTLGALPRLPPPRQSRARLALHIHAQELPRPRAPVHALEGVLSRPRSSREEYQRRELRRVLLYLLRSGGRRGERDLFPCEE